MRWAPDRMAGVGPNHPLRQLFAALCERALFEQVGLPDPSIACYLADLLTRFTHVDQLRQLRSAAGRPLDDVGEMLLACDAARDRSHDERELRRHIGDYTLFFLGLFPEYVQRHATTRVPDMYVDWVRTGRESFRMVAAYSAGPFAREAPLYAKLADMYDFSVVALNFVKHQLAALSDPRLRHLRDLLGEG
ncbi:MAG: hypothetical protein JSV80_16935 [Acidobacteriota bacterium]|nr:MAG: hypothetical protein JSV80_16935 [Acidobacteriota bacterium]